MTLKIILISGNQLVVTSHDPGFPAVNGVGIDNLLYPHRWHGRADERLFFTPISQYRLVEQNDFPVVFVDNGIADDKLPVPRIGLPVIMVIQDVYKRQGGED